MRDLLSHSEVIIAVGPGGVGKTTTAAAVAAVAAVNMDAKVLVLTVDPARRLASALGVGMLRNEALQVPTEIFNSFGEKPSGQLWAAMLDTKQAWDDLVLRHAPDRPTADRIFANSLYENVSGRFVQSHDYIAAERLYELKSSGEFDLIIVDTPPSQHAIDFLDAPSRMAEFFSSRLLRWLLAPYKSRIVGLASRPFTQVADKILGGVFLRDVAEFFQLFQSMYEGFIQRSRAVSALLAAPGSNFVVVTTLEPGPRKEAEDLIEAVTKRGLHLGGIVLNKTLPEYLLSAQAAESASRILAIGDETLEEISRAIGTDTTLTRSVLSEVSQSFTAYSALAASEQIQRTAVKARRLEPILVPHLQDDVHDLVGLVRLGRIMWTGSDRSPDDVKDS